MPTYWTKTIFTSAIVSGAALLLTACGGSDGAAGGGYGGGAAPVGVAHPLVERVVDWDVYSGRFEAPDSVNVRARVSGFLVDAHFQDGQQVTAGDLLFTIDPRPYEAAVAAAEGDVAAAQATLAQAQRDFSRAESLVESNVVSEETFENRRSAVAQARAALAAAEAALRERQLDLEFTQVTAPISGRVSDRRVDPGNLVAAGQDVLTTVVAADPIHFEFEASESALLTYQRRDLPIEGAEVEVHLSGETEYARKGVITFADNVVDSATGTIRLRAEIPNPDGFLRPGMFGDARIQGSAPYDAVLAPQTAIVSDATRRLVYVVGDDNIVEARPVELGPLSGDLRVIKSGLAPDERIVVDGLQRVRPGAPVTPQPAEIARAIEVASAEGGTGDRAAALATPIR